jgi:iron(III) transport system substrate-binding protein
MFFRLLAVCGAICQLMSVATLAHAQSWQDDWKAALDKAKGQTLTAVVQSNQSFDLIFDEFSKKFGIKVDVTVSRPSSTLARMRTEQKNGQYSWDIWWGGTSNMVNSAAPAGMIEELEKYLILPEVKDASNWRHPDYIWGEAGRHVFVHLNEISFAFLRNTKVLPEIKVANADALLDPRLKGKISMRDVSTPNFGTFALATILHEKGPAFLAKFLKEQEPRVYENPQQLEAAIVRGGQTLAIGLESSLWEQCRKDGGCKEIDQLEHFSIAISWGLSVPKNPPHPEAVKVWLNWILSKEGQEATVRNWVKHNQTGAVSMRKDVPPAPGHERYLPDFTKPDQYVFVSTAKGSKEIADTIKIFKEATGR